MSKFRKEHSSGGIVFRNQDGKIEVALISRINTRGKRVWCLPKGKVESKETPEDTAKREVREETGMDAEIVKKLGSINYWFVSPEDKTKVYKTVDFYLMEYKSGNVNDHDWEVEEVRWMDIDSALQIMEYPSEREMMLKAKQELKSVTKGGE
jgi:8-oxo-dGTP pyrophosphatase MutT (NUDIX family)